MGSVPRAELFSNMPPLSLAAYPFSPPPTDLPPAACVTPSSASTCPWPTFRRNWMDCALLSLATPSNSEQRLLPTYYRGCWHAVSRSFFFGYRHNLSRRKSFTPRGASSLTRRRCIRVSPIVQDSPLLPPVGVWPVFQCQCGRVPSQAGYRSLPW